MKRIERGNREIKKIKEKTDSEARKRSKSEERDRIRIYRESRTAQRVIDDKVKDRERKIISRGRQTEREPKGYLYNEREENRLRINRVRAAQNHEDNKIECEASKARMMAVRARKTPEEIDLEKETARERMAAIRERRTLEDDDYEKIVDKKRKRNKQKNQSGKEHLLENLKAKKGMRLLR